MRARVRILVAVTDPQSEVLLTGQLAYLRQRGAQVWVLSAPGEAMAERCRQEGANYVPIPLQRDPSPWADLIALWRCLCVIQRIRPHLVNAGTPKAGLLVTVAAAVCSRSCRIFTLRGLRSDGAIGWRARLLRLCERCSRLMAHVAIAVSPSLRLRAEDVAIGERRDFLVLGPGSSNGFAVARIAAMAAELGRRETIRDEWGVQPQEICVGFIGRLVADKGIGELIAAVETLRRSGEAVQLIALGGYDSTDPEWQSRLAGAQASGAIRCLGHVVDPARFLAGFDMLALPSYREGFPNVIIEAAAAGIPAVVTDVPGLRDAVVPGQTGLMVPVRDAAALAAAIQIYIADPALRHRHGQAAARRAWTFAHERIWSRQVALYRMLLDPGFRRRRQARREGAAQQYFELRAKRALDVLAAGCGLAFLLPLLLILAIMIRLRLGHPVCFRQVRTGRHGRPFTLIKFRSMGDRRDALGVLLPDHERLDGFGRWLRQTSLDELPELWNIVCGEMSLVGPRPLLPEYLSFYTTSERCRLRMLPGLTGLAQIQGRNRSSWAERLRWDQCYVRRWRLAWDVRILARTVTKVLAREGVEPEHGGTMERLDDSRSRPAVQAVRLDAKQEAEP